MGQDREKKKKKRACIASTSILRTANPLNLHGIGRISISVPLDETANQKDTFLEEWGVLEILRVGFTFSEESDSVSG